MTFERVDLNRLSSSNVCYYFCCCCTTRTVIVIVIVTDTVDGIRAEQLDVWKSPALSDAGTEAS
jgi:hypothetical protein